jgi:Ni/Co efflux regulator RcnB
MRKLVLALAAVAAFGLAIPVVSSPADAREVIIIKKKKAHKTHWDRGHHYGWNKKHHRYHSARHHGARVVVR